MASRYTSARNNSFLSRCISSFFCLILFSISLTAIMVFTSSMIITGGIKKGKRNMWQYVKICGNM